MIGSIENYKASVHVPIESSSHDKQRMFNLSLE
jgi:hypothetical protein